MNARHPQGQAERYAAHGWPVFPCWPGSKEPANRHGLLEASTDQRQISRWWGRHRDRNIAIATGITSAGHGPDVLDIDNHGDRGNGYGALNELKRAGLVDGYQAIVQTPSRGIHLYYAGSRQRNGSIPPRHVDFRSAGGYVLAPGSAVDGRGYEVMARTADRGGIDWGAVKAHLEPERKTPAYVPRVTAEGERDMSGLIAHVASQDKGNRNNSLFWALNRAADAGREDVFPDLANAAIGAGHPANEAWRTVQSVARRSRTGDREAAS